MAWKFNPVFQVEATLVPNVFIDEYMAGASGEYVKVYLYLLRCQGQEQDAAQVAEALHYTEGDVKRAIAYWEKMGVLALRKPPLAEENEPAGSSWPEKESVPKAPVVPVHSKEQVNRLADDEDFAQLLYIAQKYMNKVFTQRDCQVFAYLYGGLGLSAEFLEYLVEYCVQNGHTSVRYMETVALNWHQRGLVTVEQAKAYGAGFNKDVFAVMKAFGLTGRHPGGQEMQFIETWFGVYGFSREVVLEACNRTINATHSPSFKYADKILKEWKKAGVKNLSDVEELDVIYQTQGKKQVAGSAPVGQDKAGSRKAGEKKGADSGRVKQAGAVNRFHNFEQSTTDYDSLMMEKVRARMKE